MTDPTCDPVRLADDIARQLDRLTEHLAQAPPRQAAQILGHLLDAEHGILGHLTTLVTTGSRCAKKHARAGAFPPEVWLALGRATNDLNGLCRDLNEHLDDVRQLAQAPPTDSTPLPPTPTASALVARRRR
ncbi:MAG: hypothetical protein JO362_17640 [Streptomycetaceae bacterium]|nr:hypothetical protein [Streptomycetaceae bacterium]